MKSPLDWTLGYCTNVHPGTDIESIRENLTRYAAGIRVSIGQDELGVGLWLPASAASQLRGDTESFAKFLDQHSLVPYTINGFPFDNFHEDVVKHRVYKPGWWQRERLEYTQNLAQVLAELLPESRAVGSISTLPLGWPSESGSQSGSQSSVAGMIEKSGELLRELAGSLRRLEAETGKQIVVAIEAEPGCILDSNDDLIDFFQRFLPDEIHRKYITVCHDVCHSAVMMEDQGEVIESLAAAGIKLGKVQVSSAIVANWQSMSAGRCDETLQQLGAFAEDRYLHQTGRKTPEGGFELAEDLPDLLKQQNSQLDSGASGSADVIGDDLSWVVHFHVPIFLERFGHLTTSQNDIDRCLQKLADPSCDIEFTGHLEVETYAWSVLPESMRRRGLADDIAAEMQWLRRAVAEVM